jgi:uncharacterized protein (DUF433 family)
VAEALEGYHPSTRQYIVSITRWVLLLTFVLFPVWTCGQERPAQSARASNSPSRRDSGSCPFGECPTVRPSDFARAMPCSIGYLMIQFLSYDKGRTNMATLDWSQCPAVESIPGKVSGAWVFRGTRVPVSAIFENLKSSPIEEVLENFHVTRDQIQTVLDFAARSAQAPPLETLQVR